MELPSNRFKRALKDKPVRRVVFNAITRDEIRRAFADPHPIDEDRVNAQQARRILDRIVGYQVSPLLWKKVARGLSAGRVQSVAVRLIVEREREIQAFVPDEYWRVTGRFVIHHGERGGHGDTRAVMPPGVSVTSAFSAVRKRAPTYSDADRD